MDQTTTQCCVIYNISIQPNNLFVLTVSLKVFQVLRLPLTISLLSIRSTLLSTGLLSTIVSTTGATPTL